MNYISLKEAAELCSYSQEYLSLRARRGKLKAVKFGRNWMTKKEWLDEYLAGAEQYHDLIESKKKKVVIVSEPLPPANLPVDKLIQIKFGLRDIRPSLVAILVTVLLGIGWFSARENALQAYAFLSPLVAEIGKAGDSLIQSGAESLASVSDDVQTLSDTAYLAAINRETTLNFTAKAFGEYSRWLKGIIE